MSLFGWMHRIRFDPPNSREEWASLLIALAIFGPLALLFWYLGNH